MTLFRPGSFISEVLPSSIILVTIIMALGYALADDIPDHDLSPGLSDPSLTADVICAHGFTTRSIRNVPQSRKEAVYREYHITKRKPGEYEIDHIISLELGGSNDIKNLWPQSYLTHPWNAHVKDRLEDRLHKEVCAGNLSLADAQAAISGDWREAYKMYFGDPK